MKVSIVMLTYNAPKYVEHSIRTIKNGTWGGGVNYELIIYDNNSSKKTVDLLKKLKQQGLIDKLILSDKNYYFVGGTNRAVEYSSEDTDLLVLLNSDIEIRNKDWLLKMIDIHKHGITACQVCSEIDMRPDGWCLLVDKNIFLNYKLDESKFKWYFSIADFGARVMRAGYSVQTIKYYKNFIKHFGGMSEIPNDIALSTCTHGIDVNKWYPHPCTVINRLEMNKQGNMTPDVIFTLYNITHKALRKVLRMIKK